jgi:hypothetical protein
MPPAKKAQPAPTNIRPESELNAARVKIELQQLASELPDASQAQRKAIHVLVDRWLDEALNQQQAHKPSCRCDDCLNAHPLMHRHPMGECIDRRDIATEGRW